MNILDEMILKETLEKIELIDLELYRLLCMHENYTSRGRLNIAKIARTCETYQGNIRLRIDHITKIIDPDQPILARYGKSPKKKKHSLCRNCMVNICEPDTQRCKICILLPSEVKREERNAKMRDHRNQLAALGICSLCATDAARPGLRMCQGCANERKTASNERYRRIGRG